MKNTLLSLFLVVSIGLSAQQIADGSYTDCNGTTKGVHATLATGKVLIIASKGLDCGICKSHASDFQNFIASNSNSIEGWGAMVYIYNLGNTASCSDMSSWKNSYNWNNVFQFADANLDFFQSGTPRYIVVDPSDSSVAYSGSNLTTAKNTALGLISTVGFNEYNINNVKVYQRGDRLIVDGVTNKDKYTVSVINLAGQTISENVIYNGEQNELNLVSLNSGIYLIKIDAGQEVKTSKVQWIAD